MEHGQGQASGEATWQEELEAEYARGKLEGIALGIPEGERRERAILEDLRTGIVAEIGEHSARAFSEGFRQGYFDALPAHCPCFHCQEKAANARREACERYSFITRGNFAHSAEDLAAAEANAADQWYSRQRALAAAEANDDGEDPTRAASAASASPECPAIKGPHRWSIFSNGYFCAWCCAPKPKDVPNPRF